jgi:hypothetical protein
LARGNLDCGSLEAAAQLAAPSRLTSLAPGNSGSVVDLLIARRENVVPAVGSR